MKKEIKKFNQVKFYDWLFFSVPIAFIIILSTMFIFSPDEVENSMVLNTLTYLIANIPLLCGIIFIAGIVYNSCKIKKYAWVIATIIIGYFFPFIFFTNPAIFYFLVLRKEFKKKQKEIII